MYSGNAWILVGSNPGLQTSFSGTSDDIPEGQKLYFTNARARAAISVPDNTLIYNATTGSIRANVLALSNINLGNIIPSSDSIPEGSVNLYYSNSRVFANLSLASINALLDVDTVTIAPQAGYGLIWNGVRWIPNVITATALTGTVDYSNISQLANVANTVLTLSNFTTANLAESASNLYYTDARVIANISLANINVLADVDTVSVAPTYGDALSWNGNTWVPSAVNATNALTSNVANIVVSLSNHTTSNLAEGNNLYYTNARVNAQVSSNLALKANVVDLTTANVAELNNLYYTNTRAYSNLSLASINALADVDTLTVPPASGQALSWNGAAWIPATVTASYAPVSGEANVSNTVLSIGNFTTSNLAEGNNLYYTNARVNAQVAPNLALKANVVDLTTANVAELNNLYYTNSRVLSNVSLMSINVLADVNINNPSVGQVLYWNGTSWEANGVTIPATEYANIANTVVSVVSSSLTANTANFANIAGVAYTANVANLVLTLSNFTTANLTEGSRLYYTNARVNAQVESNLALKANVVDLTTANVIESASNLYYTDERVYTNVTARFASIDGNLIPDGDETRDLGSPTHKWKDLYLSGFSLTLGNTVITSSGTGGLTVQSLVSNTSITTRQITSNIWLNLYTANVRETAGNLYYTNARVNAQVESNLALKANVVDLTTANVAELNNLYYTNARVRSTLSGGTGVIYDNTSGQISIGQNVATTANVTFGALNVTGPINFYGNVTTHSSNNLAISDNMIYLNSGSESSNPDLGFAGNYNDGTYHHAGFFRDATDGKWKVFDNYSPEPGANIFIDTDHATFRLANLSATTFFGNVQGTVSTLNNFSTTDLAEGNNLYYTNARVNAQVASNLALKANVVDLTTANVAELNNLYYTNARVLSNVSQMSINVLADVDTTGITTNGTLIWNGTTFVAGVASTASSANFANSASSANTAVFATTANVANIALRATVATLADSANTSLFASTANVSNTVLTLSNFTTANLAEGSSLYYTNARVLSNVEQMSINVLADVDITNIQPNDTLVWDGTKFVKSLAGQSAVIVANVTTTGNVELTRFSTTTYSTAKYVYTIKGTSVGYTSKYNSGELLVMHDDTSSFITQYAMLSNDNNLDLLSFVAGINNGNVIIYGNVSDPAIQVTVKLTGATYTAK